ncbi:MAG: DNA recombination protein RmuC [Planctomycetes bacterium]|nr:DNA recombination protein RmuC [Planctomycetota bacterium]
MMEVVVGVLVLGCLALGGLAGWLFWDRGRLMAEAARSRAETQGIVDDLARANERAAGAEARGAELANKAAQFEVELARRAEQLAAMEMRVEVERRGLEEQKQEVKRALEKQLADADVKFANTFRALAGQVLGDTRAELTKIAEEKFKGQATIAQQDIEQRKQAVERLLQPIAETLKRTDEKLAAIEKERTGSYSELRTQVQQMMQGSEALRTATEKLGRALRDPKVRGQYGEIQLKKVAELAGMRAFCDFTEQSTTIDAEGNRLRPDMIVKLPNKREVAIDAKANLKPYLDAIEATDPAQVEGFLKAFADGIASQASALARKGYWKHYENAPEFVVMFVPGDQFVDAALSRRPDLLEFAATQRVLLASPSTLIGLLRAVHVGFQEQTLAEEAMELRRLGAELHERASVAFEHVAKLGKSLSNAAEHYNKFVASYEQRLEPTFRKFEESGAKSAKELPQVEVVGTQLRLMAE